MITTASLCPGLSFYFTNETSLFSKSSGRGNKEKSTGEKDLSRSEKWPAVSDYDRPTRPAFSVFVRRGERDLFHAADVAVDLTRDDDSTKRRNSRHDNSCASGTISPRGNVKTPTLFSSLHKILFHRTFTYPARRRRFFAEIRRCAQSFVIEMYFTTIP